MDHLYELIEEKNYEEAIVICRKMLNESDEDYYDLLDLYSKLLIYTERFNDVIDVLTKELSMPYVPIAYEESFRQDLEYAINSKKMNESLTGNTALSDEDIEDVLLHDDREMRIMVVLHQLSERNVRKFIPVIMEYLKKEKNNPIFKSMFLEILANQDVNQIITVKKRGNSYDVNPSVLELVLNHPYVKKVYHYLDQILFDNPSLFKIATDLVNTYAYIVYPDFDMDNTDIDSAAFHALSLIYQGQIVDFEAIGMMYQVDAEWLEDHVLVIQNHLNEITWTN